MILTARMWQWRLISGVQGAKGTRIADHALANQPGIPFPGGTGTGTTCMEAGGAAHGKQCWAEVTGMAWLFLSDMM